MINRLIELSLRNRFIVIALYVALAGVGLVGARRDADRRHSRPVRQPGHRVHRLAGPQPAGSRGPGHVSADREPAGARRRPRRPFAVGVRLLDDLRDLRGQRRPVFRARARARAHEPDHARRCRPASRRRSARTRPASAMSSGTRVESPTLSLRDLRTLQDWFIRYQLNCGAWRRGSRVGRRLRPAVPDRRRSEPAPRLQPAARAPSSTPSATAI